MVLDGAQANCGAVEGLPNRAVELAVLRQPDEQALTQQRGASQSSLGGAQLPGVDLEARIVADGLLRAGEQDLQRS